MLKHIFWIPAIIITKQANKCQLLPTRNITDLCHTWSETKSPLFNHMSVSISFQSSPSGLLFWLSQPVQDQVSMHSSPTRTLPRTQTVFIGAVEVSQVPNLNWADAWVNVICVIPPSSQADQPWPTGSITSSLGMWLLHTKSVFGILLEGRAVCRHPPSGEAWMWTCLLS